VAARLWKFLAISLEGEFEMSEPRYFDRHTESLSRAELDKLQLERLRAMLVHVSETNEFYRSRWDEAGVDVEKIQSFEDFRKYVPTVEKSDFLNDQLNFPPFGKRMASSAAGRERVEIYTTSGTSGQGVEVHMQSMRELAVMEKLYGFYLTWAGLQSGDSTMLTLPITMLAGGRAEYQGAVGHGLTTYPIGNYASQQKVDLIKRFKPKSLFGSTSYLAHLATQLGEDAKRCGVEVLLTGLEGVGPSFFERLQDQWGAPAADRFGCAQMRADFMFTDERGVGNAQNPGVLVNADPFVYLEVLDVNTGLPVADGEFGELVVTSLYHFDNPVIRNRLKDGGIFRKGSIGGAKRQFNGVQVGSITRIDDVKKIKGINVYPQAVDDVMYSLPEVEQYEVILSSTADYTDQALLNIQCRNSVGAIPPESGVRIRSILKERLGINFDIAFVTSIEVSDYKARRWKDLRTRD